MAGADHHGCANCSAKTFYDAGLNFDDDIRGRYYDALPDGVGDMLVLCPKCNETLTIEIIDRPTVRDTKGDA